MLMRNDSTTTTTTTVGQRVTVINLTRRGGNAAIAITPGVWINEDDGNWNMLIATTRRSDYYPGTACAGHQTNKQTLPGRRRRRRKRKEPVREWEEKVEIICSLFVGIYVEISTWKAQWRDPRETSEVGVAISRFIPPHIHRWRGSYIVSPVTLKRGLFGAEGGVVGRDVGLAGHL